MKLYHMSASRLWQRWRRSPELPGEKDEPPTRTVWRRPAAAGWLQRALSSPRFSGDSTLENIHDGNATLSNGDSGAPVRKIQHAIHDAGIRFSEFGTDGECGDQTEQRVEQFQSANTITTDPNPPPLNWVRPLIKEAL